MNKLPKIPIFESDISFSNRYLYLLIVVSSLYGLKLLFFFLDLSYKKELEGKTFSQLEEIQNKRRQDLQSYVCFRYRTSTAWIERVQQLLQVLPEILTHVMTNEALFWCFITFEAKDIESVNFIFYGESGITSTDQTLSIIVVVLLLLQQAFLVFKVEHLESSSEYYISY